MHFLSYRKRVLLKNAAKAGALILGAVVLISLFYLLYMDRYIVYFRDGAHVNTQWQEEIVDSGELELLNVTPNVTELESTAVSSTSVRRLSGCYVTVEMLVDLENTKAAVANGGYTTVMIEVKSGDGTFYYSSGLDEAVLSSRVDYAAVTAWIKQMKNNGVYLIAAIPAFADRNYCLNHIDLGLPLASGALWMDSSGCYWMDPAESGTISYLQNICHELSSLGFQEVMLQDFYIPTDSSIVYDESEHTRAEALASAVQVLQANMATEDMMVSFGLSVSSGFPISISSGRLYFTVNDPNMLETYAGNYRQNILSAEMQLVFLSSADDLAFSDYGYLEPAVVTTTQ